MFPRVFFAFFLAFLLAGCGNPHEKFVGFWERTDTKKIEVMEITQDGDAYRINLNVLKEKSKPILLAKTEDGFTLSLPLGQAVPLAVSANAEQLMMVDTTYQRVPLARVDEIRQEILQKEAKAIADQEAGTAKCKQLKDEYAVKADALKATHAAQQQPLEDELAIINEEHQAAIKTHDGNLFQLGKAFEQKLKEHRKKFTELKEAQHKASTDLHNQYSEQAKALNGRCIFF